MGYRDALAAGRQRVRQRRQDLQRRQAAFDKSLLARLPRPLRQRLEALGDCLNDVSVDKTTLDATLANLDSLTAVLDEVALQIPEIERRLHQLPQQFLRPIRQERLPEPRGAETRCGVRPWTVEEHRTDERWRTPFAWLRHYIAELDPNAGAQVEEHRYQTERSAARVLRYVAAFRHLSMPVLFIGTDWEDGVCLTVPVREATPHLLVRPERWGDALAKRFSRRRDAQLGDDDFDGMFLIDGDDAVAARVLTQEVRRHMRTVAKFDEPTLNIEHGSARVRFKSDGTKAPFDAAMAMMTHIHNIHMN